MTAAVGESVATPASDAAATQFQTATGYTGAVLLLPLSATAVSADANTLILGQIGILGTVVPLLKRKSLNDRTETSGMELFEGMITATERSGQRRW